MESEDLRLVRAALAGDQRSFAELVSRHERYVFAVVSRHVPRDHVEEVAHEAFVHAYLSLANYRSDAPFKHWLATIAVRRCYDFYRARRRREVPLSELSSDGLELCDAILAPRSADEARRNADQEEARQILGLVLERLSPEDRMVVTLIHVDQRSVKEAAELLGWTAVNVKVRAFRARRQLRRLIEELDGPGAPAGTDHDEEQTDGSK